MRRKLFTGASAISLLLCAALVGLWIMSYWKAESVCVYRLNANGIQRNPWLNIGSERGLVGLSVGRDKDSWFDRLSAPYIDGLLTGSVTITLTNATPAPPHCRNWYLEYASWRCPTCFYNLTGNTCGVCPECGTPVPQPGSHRQSATKPPAFVSPPPPHSSTTPAILSRMSAR